MNKNNKEIDNYNNLFYTCEVGRETRIPLSGVINIVVTLGFVETCFCDHQTLATHLLYPHSVDRRKYDTMDEMFLLVLKILE
jgi:hypothetical protein